jgi:hypothetical protein
MKKLLLIGVAALLATTTINAQDTNPPAGSTKDRLISFVQDTGAAKSLVLAIYPTFAPSLLNARQEKDQWGFGAAALYPVSQYLYTGIRIDYLASEFWAPSINVGLKADVQVFGINFTPMVYTGGVVPLSGAGDKNGDWGYIVGGGVKARVWAGTVFGKQASLDLAATAEKWSQFDGEVYHIAPVFKISW